jgi:hypothetical protein
MIKQKQRILWEIFIFKIISLCSIKEMCNIILTFPIEVITLISFKISLFLLFEICISLMSYKRICYVRFSGILKQPSANEL